MKKYAYFLLIFMVALFAAIGSEFKESGTVAKYLSKIDGSDSARVAKWDISAVDKDGESIVMVAESRTVPSGSGEWYFQISNNSEVAAKISSSSEIKIRLDATQFLYTTEKDEIKNWDFFATSEGNIDNPINFRLDSYNGEITYKVIEAFTFNETNYAVNRTVNVETYNTLIKEDSSLKSKLSVVYPNTTPVVVFNTETDDDIEFICKVDMVGTNPIHYLEATIPVSEIDLGYDGIHTYKLSWSVVTPDDDDSGSGSLTQEFIVYTYKEGSNSEYTQKSYEYYEYLKYLSSIEGEPKFFIDGRERRYSALTAEYKQVIKDESEPNGYSYEYDIVADLNLRTYESFLAEKERFEANLGYLEMGLIVGIEFDLNVEQVD